MTICIPFGATCYGKVESALHLIENSVNHEHENFTKMLHAIFLIATSCGTGRIL